MTIQASVRQTIAHAFKHTRKQKQRAKGAPLNQKTGCRHDNILLPEIISTTDAVRDFEFTPH
eukprot:5067907-Amphidinium_carterae.1